MSELFKADNEYKEWIAGISTDFRKSQIRASMKINDEMLRFYWKLGKGISSMSEQFGYGTRFYKKVSDDLITDAKEILQRHCFISERLLKTIGQEMFY